MLLYENALASNYDEIKTWYPVWQWEIYEMDAIWKAWGSLLDDIQAEIIQGIDNNFIDYADAPTITKLEAWLRITHDFPRTLVERRNIIKAFIIGQGKIGRKEIIDILHIFTGGVVEVGFSAGIIYIEVTRDFGDALNLIDIHMALDNRLPAHLQLDITDNVLPVSAFNENTFKFHNLNMRFRIINKTARLDGILLDGSRDLDGSWILNATRPGIVFIDFGVGVTVENPISTSIQELEIVGLTIPNTFTVSAGLETEERWALDGSVRLNGSKPLAVLTTKEEL